MSFLVRWRGDFFQKRYDPVMECESIQPLCYNTIWNVLLISRNMFFSSFIVCISEREKKYPSLLLDIYLR